MKKRQACATQAWRHLGQAPNSLSTALPRVSVGKRRKVPVDTSLTENRPTEYNAHNLGRSTICAQLIHRLAHSYCV